MYTTGAGSAPGAEPTIPGCEWVGGAVAPNAPDGLGVADGGADGEGVAAEVGATVGTVTPPRADGVGADAGGVTTPAGTGDGLGEGAGGGPLPLSVAPAM
jgi:hypothetical protein